MQPRWAKEISDFLLILASETYYNNKKKVQFSYTNLTFWAVLEVLYHTVHTEQILQSNYISVNINTWICLKQMKNPEKNLRRLLLNWPQISANPQPRKAPTHCVLLQADMGRLRVWTSWWSEWKAVWLPWREEVLRNRQAQIHRLPSRPRRDPGSEWEKQSWEKKHEGTEHSDRGLLVVAM